MTTRSKYLEARVTQGGVLGAKGEIQGEKLWTMKVKCMESFLY